MTSRAFHPIPVIRKRLSIPARVRDAVLTILLWWVYIIFMKGFFIFFIDAFRWAGNGFSGAVQYESFKILPTLLSYVEATVVFIVIYIGWARYNQIRFRGKSRRRAAEPVQPADLAKFYGLQTRQVEKWQQAKILTIHHDPRGHIVGVELGSPGLPVNS